MDLLLRYNHRPRLAGLAKHLLSLKQLAPIEDLLFYVLSGGGSGVDRLLYSIDVGDNHAGRRRCVGEAVELDDARRVRFLGLARVALREELHARRLARVQRIVLYHHLREEFQHLLFVSSRVLDPVFLNSLLGSCREREGEWNLGRTGFGYQCIIAYPLSPECVLNALKMKLLLILQT